MRLLRRFVNNNLRALVGYEIKKVGEEIQEFVVELDSDEIGLITDVLDSGYTLASVSRLVNTVKSCKYVVENDIPGDFVECGVWRGGNGILAKKIFERMGSDKKVWMFDTFEGMTAPTKFDVQTQSKVPAERRYKVKNNGAHSEWCYASLEEVRRNCEASSIKLESVRFVKGDVCETLGRESNRPEHISVLRLDTDWYESTKIELETLYPILAERGVLIIDDYGYWDGSRKAVDEYFGKSQDRPFFSVVDSAGRSAIKA